MLYINTLIIFPIGVLIVVRLWHFASVMHDINDTMQMQANQERESICLGVQQKLAEVRTHCSTLQSRTQTRIWSSEGDCAIALARAARVNETM